jgi:hypothetical protein
MPWEELGKSKVSIDQSNPGISNAVTLTGSNLEYYGATIDDRPSANSVPVGAVFKAIDTNEFWQSNGTDWVVI